MSEFGDEVESFFGKKARIVGGIIVALIAVYIITALIGGLWPFSSAVGVVNKVTKAEYIVQNYEWFYAQKAEIDATKMKAKIARGTENESGILMVLASMIGEYNARSKMISRNIWKAKDLPYTISMGDKE